MLNAVSCGTQQCYCYKLKIFLQCLDSGLDTISFSKEIHLLGVHKEVQAKNPGNQILDTE